MTHVEASNSHKGGCHLPPTRTVEGRNSPLTVPFQGHVVKVDNAFGFIKPVTPLPAPFKNQWVFFHFSILNGRKLDVGDVVKFSLEPGREVNPKACLIECDALSNTSKTKAATYPTKKQQQLIGVICQLDGDSGHLRVSNCEGNFFFLRQWVKSADFPLALGDSIVFSCSSLVTYKRRSVYQLRLKRCKSRNVMEIEDYLTQLLEKLRGPDNPQLISELLLTEGVWLCIADEKNLPVEAMLDLTEIIFLIEEKSKSLATSFKCMLNWLFGNWSWGLRKLITVAQEDSRVFDRIKKLVLLIAVNLPEECVSLVSAMKPLVACGGCGMDELLYDMLEIVTGQIPVSLRKMGWHQLPQILSQEEINGVNLPLMPAKVIGAYNCADEYFDTYFRLLREDCFQGIRTGISNYLQGSLEPRDMDIYTDVRVTGISVSKRGKAFHLALKFCTLKPIDNWEKSPKLMHGNLVCLSPDGTFSDCMFATVSERDTAALNSRQTIWVELCVEFCAGSEIRCLSTLVRAGKGMLMAESPTYYRAYEPVLKALQSTNPESMSFMEELVKLEETSAPEYKTPGAPSALEEEIQPTSDLVSHNLLEAAAITDPGDETDASSVASELESVDRSYTSDSADDDGTCTSDSADDNLKGRISSIRRFRSFMTTSDTLDSSQKEAFGFGLSNRLALIQGPPGTGKTYIGAQLVKEILKKEGSTPILVLSYKNHALDEFLKHLLSVGLSHIVRVGGRSRDESLEMINMKNLIRGFHWRENGDQIDALHETLVEQLKELVNPELLNTQKMLWNLSKQQLHNLLLCAPWGRMPYKFQIRTVDIMSLWYQEKESLYDETIPKAKRIRNINSDLLWYIDAALQLWRPTLGMFQKVIQRTTIAVKTESELQKSKASDTDTNSAPQESEGDEEDVKQQLEERRSGDVGKDNALEIDIPVSHNSLTDILLKQALHQDMFAQLQRRKNPWSLSKEERVLFVQAMLWRSNESLQKKCQDILNEYCDLLTAKEEFEMQTKARLLSENRVIGMTMTGASIHYELLKQVRPPVVLIEEAAEILEPQVVAAIGDWAKHLILIGDHKQLRPQVQSYNLCKDYHLDVSMFERLIKNGFKHACLRFQNRMRVEMASLLTDIYPDLESNSDRIRENNPPDCVPHSIYVWTHCAEELVVNRSFVNEEEAQRALKLAQMFVQHGWAPSQITILAAYRAQLHLLRKQIKKFPDLTPPPKEDISQCEHNVDRPDKNSSENVQPNYEDRVQTFTIDMYQGDENDIVIVSLVRSNKDGSIGFMRTLNRRCVAQSRAKCGLYFIGNVSMFSSSCWEPFFSQLQERHLVRDTFQVQCPVHGTIEEVASADDIPCESVCKLPCDKKMECEIHPCGKTCQPKHSHQVCKEKVFFRFVECGHPGERLCHIPEERLHCRRKCPDMMACGVHRCSLFCYNCQGEESHKSTNCTAEVDCVLPCNHLGSRRCNRSVDSVFCSKQCGKELLCGKHHCIKTCGTRHTHLAESCRVYVSFTFSKCKHVGRKKCGESEEMVKCVAEVTFTFDSCGHTGEKLCFEPMGKYKCTERCPRNLSCGHPCPGQCGDLCDASRCKQCKKILEAKIEQQRKLEQKARDEAKQAANRELDELKRKLRKHDVTFSQTELSRKDDSASEYLDVEDKVKKYIQPGHRWYPCVTKIEKVTNLRLLRDWVEAKSHMFDPLRSELKFHGTDAAAVASITRGGFRLPKKDGMFGQGIYFATDASKSAQDKYVKGSNMLLLCDVLIGKSLTLTAAAPHMCNKELRKRRYDSIFAPRDTARSGGVLYDEYVVYKPSQALPKYIIHYEKQSVEMTPHLMQFEKEALSGKSLQHYSIKPQREFSHSDALQMHFRIAESQFLRLKSHRGLQAEVSTVEYYVNPVLVDRFRKKEAEFERKYGTSSEAQSVLAFHGTDPANMDSIIQSNFSMDYCQRGLYGKGIYFSEFPEESEKYGRGSRSLLLCLVLVGKTLVCTHAMNDQPLKPGYDSHTVADTSKANMGKMIVISDPDQVLPSYIVKF